MTETIVVNSTPTPDIVMALSRDLLKVAGAALVARGVASDGMLEACGGLVLAMVPMGWTLFVTWLRSSRFAALARDPDIVQVVAKGAEAVEHRLAPAAPAAAMEPSL